MRSVHKRSTEAIERRKKKKRERARKKTSIIPNTGIDKQRFQPPYNERYVNYSYIHTDTHNGVLIHF